MSRKQSYFPADNFEILMDGSKSFWKTRSNLDILIALHPKLLCIEIIAYNAEIGVEAPRLYVSSMAIATKIDPKSTEFTEKLSKKKEVYNRQKKSYNLPDLTKSVYNDLELNYIMQRLGVVTEGVDLSKELKIKLSPQTGDVMSDDDPTRLDIIMDAPPHMKKVEVCFAKKASASEILRAQHVLNAEREKLAHATKLAELSAQASDNFKHMIEEKRRLALAMKSLSKARLRWIKAINMVLIQNYIEHVKRRLLNSSFAGWYKECIARAEAAEREEAIAARAALRASQAAEAQQQLPVGASAEEIAEETSFILKTGSTKNGRDKKARRSIDNSLLPQLGGTPSDSAENSPRVERSASNEKVLPQLGSPSNKTKPDKLLLDPMERRRQAKAERESKSAKTSAKSHSRRSFNGETELEKDKKANRSASEKVLNSKPPSLADSYSEKVPKAIGSVAIPTIEPSVSAKSSNKATRRPRV